MELPEKLNPHQLGCDTPSPPCDMKMMSPGSVKNYVRHDLRNVAVDVFLNEAVEQIRNPVSDNRSRSVLLNAINELRRLMVRDDEKNGDNGDETTFRNAITALGTYAAAGYANQHKSTVTPLATVPVKKDLPSRNRPIRRSGLRVCYAAIKALMYGNGNTIPLEAMQQAIATARRGSDDKDRRRQRMPE